MQSLRGESILYESPLGQLMLTTHRVRHYGTGTIKSIMLEEVASCAMTRRTQPGLLILAALCVFGGLIGSIQAGPGAFVAGIVLGLLFVLAYLGSREQVVAIASAGATIFLNTRKWSQKEVLDFLDQIESAKNARFLAVRGQVAAVARP